MKNQIIFIILWFDYYLIVSSRELSGKNFFNQNKVEINHTVNYMTARPI